MLPLPLYPDREAGAPGPAAPARRSAGLLATLLAAAAFLLGGLVAHFVFQVPASKILLTGVVLAALGFDFVNGMNDSGNAIATVISTRVLTPIAALIMAAGLNFLGAIVMEGVAKSIAGRSSTRPPDRRW